MSPEFLALFLRTEKFRVKAAARRCCPRSPRNNRTLRTDGAGCGQHLKVPPILGLAGEAIRRRRRTATVGSERPRGAPIGQFPFPARPGRGARRSRIRTGLPPLRRERVTRATPVRRASSGSPLVGETRWAASSSWLRQGSSAGCRLARCLHRLLPLTREPLPKSKCMDGPMRASAGSWHVLKDQLTARPAQKNSGRSRSLPRMLVKIPDTAVAFSLSCAVCAIDRPTHSPFPAALPSKDGVTLRALTRSDSASTRRYVMHAALEDPETAKTCSFVILAVFAKAPRFTRRWAASAWRPCLLCSISCSNLPRNPGTHEGIIRLMTNSHTRACKRRM
jgi:hypothetical protein